MQCEICHRSSSNRLPFNCTLCARNALYQPRIQLAQTLLHTESLAKEVEQNVLGTSKKEKVKSVANTKASDLNHAWTVQRAASDQFMLEEKTQTILSHVEALREETQKIKAEIAARKVRLSRRRSEFASAKQELSQGQKSAVEPLDKGIKRTEHRWDVMHNKTAESRLFLCREVALLYGLHQRKRKKGGLGRDVYFIGGVPIADLRDLNNAAPAHVTTSTTNLAHLTHLVSHYLSLRLPAQINLPHSDYPFPTIFSPSSSYTSREATFPGSTPHHSSHNSPSASRLSDNRPPPRHRPLHLDKKLSALAKDDPVAYASFVEGVTFLAWDIAWLCKTQGMNTGGSSWEEVCAMGKNLWHLLLAPPSRPPVIREDSSRSSPQKPTNFPIPNTSSRPPTADNSKDAPTLGHFSHGTAYGFLASASGVEYMRDWRLQAPVKVIEKVKAMLLAERTGAEWEILEGNEWEEEEGQAEAPVDHVGNVGNPKIEETGVLVPPQAEVGVQYVGNRNRTPRIEETGVLVPGRGMKVGIGSAEQGGGVEGGETEEKGKGASGWMKLKSR